MKKTDLFENLVIVFFLGIFLFFTTITGLNILRLSTQVEASEVEVIANEVEEEFTNQVQ